MKMALDRRRENVAIFSARVRGEKKISLGISVYYLFFLPPTTTRLFVGFIVPL